MTVQRDLAARELLQDQAHVFLMYSDVVQRSEQVPCPSCGRSPSYLTNIICGTPHKAEMVSNFFGPPPTAYLGLWECVGRRGKQLSVAGGEAVHVEIKSSVF